MPGGAIRGGGPDLREAGLMCVEKVVAWVLAVSDPAEGPTPFFWNGFDYLLKMFTDLVSEWRRLGAGDGGGGVVLFVLVLRFAKP